jgi:hypothetical protein
MDLISSATPQRTAYCEVPSHMAAHQRIGSPLLAGETAGFEPRIVGFQSGVTINEPPLLPNECSGLYDSVQAILKLS